MFEKEAEEYAIENWEHYEEGQNDSKALKQAYLAGAEFGYNKANEWNKVVDGDLPNDYRYVWTNVGAGYHDDDGWWDDFGRLQNVIAWCEPKFCGR